jgi:hypothetical protein
MTWEKIEDDRDVTLDGTPITAGILSAQGREMLRLKISSLPVGSVQQDCTLSLERNTVSGAVRLTAVVVLSPS